MTRAVRETVQSTGSVVNQPRQIYIANHQPTPYNRALPLSLSLSLLLRTNSLLVAQPPIPLSSRFAIRQEKLDQSFHFHATSVMRQERFARQLNLESVQHTKCGSSILMEFFGTNVDFIIKYWNLLCRIFPFYRQSSMLKG